MAKPNIKVKGGDKVIKNLNREIAKIKGNIDKGLIAAAVFIEGESNQIVPHDTGDLLGSSFSGPVKKGLVRIGYTAGYAPFVHEMPSSNNFTKPGTEPGFLLKAVTRNVNVILRIIHRRAKF